MSLGSETPEYKNRQLKAESNNVAGFFDPHTGIYQDNSSNVIQFRARHSKTSHNPDIQIDKWPAYKSLGFAIAASLTLWSGIIFLAKSLF
ncbi:hypothetical protein [Hirschia maritima]|uniref:hypothetical protein n=1 Tax=Hirschia maritima TaxID=1121961 RepID=UPI00036DAF44|nr:hypothetical protein [Hirschia maritima]